MYQKIFLLVLLIACPFCSFSLSQLSADNDTAFFNDIKDNPWAFDGEAVYLRSENSIQNAHYNFDFAWGYTLNAKYDLNVGRAVNIRWLKFTDKNEIPVKDVNVIGIELAYFGRQSQELEILNFNLRQELSFIDRILITLFAGVQYVNYNKTLDVQAISGLVNVTTINNSSFYGVGPRIGFGIDYNFFQAFNFSIEAAYTSIISRIGKTIEDQSVGAAGGSTVNKHSEKNEKGPVGGFEGNMMLEYSIKRREGVFTLRGGMMGISFDIKDTKYEGMLFGAAWHGNG